VFHYRNNGAGIVAVETKLCQQKSVVQLGGVEGVKKAIANGANFNAVGFRPNGSLVKSPLHEAA